MENQVDEKEMEYRDCIRIFRLGQTLYVSTKEVVFPIEFKVEEDNFIRKENNG